MMLAAVRTPLSEAQALGALAAANGSLASSRAALDLVAGQSATETAAWAAMWRWNFGNIQANAAWTGDTQLLPGLSTPFRAYPDMMSGARDYVSFLQKIGALQVAVSSGSLSAYRNALQKECYLGCVGDQVTDADYDVYEKNIGSWAATLSTVTPEHPPIGGLRLDKSRVALAYAGAAAVIGGAAFGTLESKGWDPMAKKSFVRRHPVWTTLGALVALLVVGHALAPTPTPAPGTGG